MLRSNSGSGECSKSVPLRRKKSVPTGRGDTRYGTTSKLTNDTTLFPFGSLVILQWNNLKKLADVTVY
jgi:hypothetical protein